MIVDLTSILHRPVGSILEALMCRTRSLRRDLLRAVSTVESLDGVVAWEIVETTSGCPVIRGNPLPVSEPSDHSGPLTVIVLRETADPGSDRRRPGDDLVTTIETGCGEKVGGDDALDLWMASLPSTPGLDDEDFSVAESWLMEGPPRFR